jgi:hypothetical protein
MAFKVHQIKKYQYSFDARAGGPGKLQLWSDTAKIADVAFVSETASVPPPVIAADLGSATVSFKRSSLPDLIDMLRNEDPVSVTINNQSPGFVFISTGLEPVGEAEF